MRKHEDRKFENADIKENANTEDKEKEAPL